MACGLRSVNLMSQLENKTPKWKRDKSVGKKRIGQTGG